VEHIMTMGRTLVLGGWAFLAGALALGSGPASAWAREVPQSFDNGAKVASEPPSEAELMYEAMKRSGRGGKNDAAIDRAIARAQKDSEKNRKALRMELAARSWKDPFVDEGDRSSVTDSARSGGGDDEVLSARAETARARKETARAKAEAAAARREAARIKADAARTEAVAQADAALARAEAARANAVAAKAEAAAALSDAQAARASCGALRSGDGYRAVHRPLASRSPAAPKRFPPTMGRARLASATVSRTTQPAEAPPPAVDDIPKAPPPSAPVNGAPATTGGFIVVPIPPAPPVQAQGRAGRRPSS
jgi:hypothetical protein